MDDSAKSLTQKARAAHAELRELNRHLIEYLEQPRPSPSSPESHDWASRLYRQLTELHEKLSLQFRVSKQAEVLSRLSERHPRAAPRLEKLQGDHVGILNDLKAIVSASMSYAEARTPPNPRLREWTRSLLENVDRHEAEESALIQELVTTDVGAGD